MYSNVYEFSNKYQLAYFLAIPSKQAKILRCKLLRKQWKPTKDRIKNEEK
jgi:hypothetical protein